MISANGGLPAHRYTPQVTQRWPRGSEPASAGSEDVRLGRFGSQRLDHPGIHLRRHSLLRELNSTVSSGLGIHSLHRLDDLMLFLSIPLG